MRLELISLMASNMILYSCVDPELIEKMILYSGIEPDQL